MTTTRATTSANKSDYHYHNHHLLAAPPPSPPPPPPPPPLQSGPAQAVRSNIYHQNHLEYVRSTNGRQRQRSPRREELELDVGDIGDVDDDDDRASVTSTSTEALQNIREQMAISLRRMRDLEEQVKLVPLLQVRPF